MGLFDKWNIKDFDVHLSTTTLNPGQVLSGNMVFTVTNEMSFRSVTLKIIGKEKTLITTAETSPVTHAEVHEGVRNFFKVHITALGMPKWGDEWKGTLSPGIYNFPFAVRLPIDSLPTLHHATGGAVAEVKYYVKAKIGIPFGTNSDKKAPFTVTCLMPHAQHHTVTPLSTGVRQIKQSCCCCSRGFTSITCDVDKSHVVFGTDTELNGTIVINNSASKEAIKTVKVALVQHTSITAEGQSAIIASRVAKANIDTNVRAHQQGDYSVSFKLDISNPEKDEKSASLPRSFLGVYMTHTYHLAFSSGWDELGRLSILAASGLDASNTAAYPIQTDTMIGTTIGKGLYPRFLYSPPRGGTAQVPAQSKDIGPFPCQPPLEPLPSVQ